MPFATTPKFVFFSHINLQTYQSFCNDKTQTHRSSLVTDLHNLPKYLRTTTQLYPIGLTTSVLGKEKTFVDLMMAKKQDF